MKRRAFISAGTPVTLTFAATETGFSAHIQEVIVEGGQPAPAEPVDFTLDIANVEAGDVTF